MDWLRVKNKGSIGEIYIYGDITSDDWDDTTSPIKLRNEIKSVKGKKLLNIYINSPGGSVFAGMAIYNILNRFPGKINVSIDGVAASIASVIAMAGDKISMNEGTLFMTHNPMSLIAGNAEELKKEIELLDKVKDSIISVYESRTGIGKEKLAAMMDEETWFTPQEALEVGFIDEITNKKVKATISNKSVIYNSISMDISKFKSFPKEQLQTIDFNAYKEQISNLKKGV